LAVLGVASALLLLSALQFAPSAVEAMSSAARSAGPVSLALLATLATAAATGIGGLPVLFLRGLSQRSHNTLLGFGAGVVLAATCFSLILPALESGAAIYGNGIAGGLIVAVALALGFITMMMFDTMLGLTIRIETPFHGAPAGLRIAPLQVVYPEA
jgi:ZIP family zinc transporter